MTEEATLAVKDAAQRTRDLAAIRHTLRAYEVSELAEVAAYLSRATESLLEVSGRLSQPISETWLTLERAATELGYVDKAGAPRREAFALAMKQAGVPRAELSRTRIYFRREDLDELLTGLRRA